MNIECQGRKFKLTKEDWVLFNGACYQIMTQHYTQNWYKIIPKIAKSKAAKLIKSGDLVEFIPIAPLYYNPKYKYYKIKGE